MVFEGVGKLKNIQVFIHVDEEIKLIVQPYRRVPYHLRKKLENKLAEFKKLDLTEYVGSKPTKWVLPMVVAPKSGDKSCRKFTGTKE